MNVGQAKIAALETIGQLLVVETEQVEDGRVEVVDVDFVFGRIEAEVIRLAEGEAGFRSAAGQPHREAIRMVVAPVVAALLATESEFMTLVALELHSASGW